MAGSVIVGSSFDLSCNSMTLSNLDLNLYEPLSASTSSMNTIVWLYAELLLYDPTANHHFILIEDCRLPRRDISLRRFKPDLDLAAI